MHQEGMEEVEKQERERIEKELDNISKYVGNSEAIEGSKRAISLTGSRLYFDVDRFWQALKGGK